MVSRKSGSSGKSGDGGEAGWLRKSKRRRGDPTGSPLRLYRKRDALFQGALPPKGFATKGLRRQGAVPPEGFAAGGLCRRRALPPKGFAAKGYPFMCGSSTNQQFPILSLEQAERLGKDFSFDDYGPADETHRNVRFCTSWATTREQVETLLSKI